MRQILEQFAKRSRFVRAVLSELNSLSQTYLGVSGGQLKKLQKMKGSKERIPAFVFGNGPSLNLLDIPKFEEFRSRTSAELFVVNNFLASEMARHLNPDHLVLSDPASFTDQYMAVLDAYDMQRRVGSLWIPAGRIVEKRFMPKNVTHFNDRESLLLFRRNISPRLPRGYISMTAYKALAIAVYLGFNPIYILGIDNTYLDKIRVDKDNRVYQTDSHFDSKAYPNDSVKNYWPSDQGFDVGSFIREIARLFDDMKLFPSEIIQHLDPDSLVDAFPKNRNFDLLRICNG